MNAESMQHAFKWLPEEIPNFQTRATTLVMHIPLTSRIPKKYLNALSKCSDEMLYMLYEFKNETDMSDKNIFLEL